MTGFYMKCNTGLKVKFYSVKMYVLNGNPLSASPTKWSNTLKQFVGCYRQIEYFLLFCGNGVERVEGGNKRNKSDLLSRRNIVVPIKFRVAYIYDLME